MLSIAQLIVADHVASLHVHNLQSSNGYFKHKNASIHKKIFSNWFCEHASELDVFQYSCQSPALYPVEHLWDVVQVKLCRMNVYLAHLWQLSDSVMCNRPKSQKKSFQHLVESMSKRTEVVLKGKVESYLVLLCYCV